MKRFTLLLTDITILYGWLLVTLLIRYGGSGELGSAINSHFLPFTVLFLLWLFVFYVASLFEISVLKNGTAFYALYGRTILINAILGIVFFYLTPFFAIAPRRNLFLFIIIFALLDFGARVLFNKIILTSTFKRRTIVMGLNNATVQLVKMIGENPQFGYEIEAIFASKAEPTLAEQINIPVIHEFADLQTIITEKNIETIVISPETYQLPQMIELFYQLIPLRIRFYNLADFYEQVSQKVILESIDQAWFLQNFSESSKRTLEISKRLFDTVIAVAFGLLALALSPLIILAIKLDSTGPVIFKQTRVGRLGHKFKIIKFRTMIENAEEKSGAVWAGENDTRITRIGRWLRRTRLDEIPQLWNILKGDMSFVGPRAERPEFHKELKENIPFYEERYLIKPGLSGWAQIQYRYGASIKDAAEKLQYDLYYIKHRSLMLDLAIILKTINIVLRQLGR